MCFSFKTSILSMTIGLLSSIFALCTNQITLGFLIFFYTQMQIAEAMIWRGIDTNQKSLNRKGTSYAKYILPTHNLAIGIGYLVALYSQKKEIQWQDFIPLLIGIFFYFYILLIYKITKGNDLTFPKKKVPKSCQNPNNRLVWPFQQNWYIISFIISLLILFFLKTMSNSSKILLCLFFSFLFLSSIFIQPYPSIGSLFCFLTAIISPILVLSNYFLLQKK